MSTPMACEIPGEGTRQNKQFSLGNKGYLFLILLCVCPQLYWQPRTEMKMRNRGFLFGFSFSKSFVNMLMTVLAQNRHLIYAAVLLSPVVLQHLFKCLQSSGADFYCQSWTASFCSLLRGFYSCFENLALAMSMSSICVRIPS